MIASYPHSGDSVERVRKFAMSDIKATQPHAQPSLQHLEYILLKDVPKHLPAPYRNVHNATIWRWASKGLGPNKTKLKTMKTGGPLFVDERWLETRFGG